MDFATLLGLAVAVGAILGGNALEGGHFASLVQVTAAVIVFGGTAGATLVAYPLRDCLRALKMGGSAFRERRADFAGTAATLVELAGVARRDGVLALESRLSGLGDAFLRRSVGYVVDGVDAAAARDMLEAEIRSDHAESTVGVRVFESAGGFSPTIGILGAVLGLIHVMNNLNDPGKLGPGIAVAFVATVYGVGSANLVFLPLASKLKRRLAVERDRKTMIAEGVLSIQEGVNPRVLEAKLSAYTGLADRDGAHGR